MTRQKKITVFFYPNKNEKLEAENSNESVFTVYCRLTYDRISTKFSLNQHFTDENKKYAQQLIDIHLEGEYERGNSLPSGWHRDHIKHLVRYEIENTIGDYSVVGFGKRLEKYDLKISLLLLDRLFEKIFSKLRDALTYNQYIHFQEYFKVIKNEEYSLFSIYVVLDFLDEKFDLNMINILGDDFHEMMQILRSFYSYNIFKHREISSDRFKIHNSIRTGEWLSNFQDIRSSFMKFMESDIQNSILNRYHKESIAKEQDMDIVYPVYPEQFDSFKVMNFMDDFIASSVE